jgi:hypothetical protein
MNLTDIRSEMQVNKQHQWEWMRDLTSRQADLLFTFARDAFDQEGKRGEHLDSKGNWILAACLGGMSLVAVAGRAIVAGLSPDLYFIIATGIVLAVVSFTLAAVWIVWGIRVNRGWFPPNPELVLRPDIFTDNDQHLARDIILHYVRRPSDDQKWLRLFEQISAIYKWTPGWLREVQSCPRRRSALATNRPTRWATRGAPRISFYAASSSFDTKSR